MLMHCRTQARRHFAKPLEKVLPPIDEEALRQIAELYAIETHVRGAAPDMRLAAREEPPSNFFCGCRP